MRTDLKWVGVLVAAFVVLGVVYSVATPIFETPDELQHYAHVNYISRYWWFPPLGKTGEHLWDQQAAQAPLFYWTAALATTWIDTSDLGQQALLQPKANIGDATLPGKKNAFLHGPNQSFPYQNTTLAVHICRWLSVLLGAGTVVLTYLIARLMFNDDHWLAFLSAGVVAFIPQFIFINASCTNDSAITFTSTFSLFCLLWIARNGVTPKRAVLFGLALGLMALSKLTGTVLAGVGLVLLLVLTRRWREVLIGGLAFTVVAGWWYLRNHFTYGDPLALGAFLNVVGGNFDIPAMSFASLWDEFRLMRFSLWGLFGHISVLIQPVWIYLIFDYAALIGAIGFVWWLARGIVVETRHRRVSKPKYDWSNLAHDLVSYLNTHQLLLITIIWLATVLAIGARWFFAAGIQGRLIFPSLAAGAVLWTLGITTLLRRLSPRILALGIMLPMAAFAVAVVPAYLIPAYSPPPLVDQVPAGVNATEIQFGDSVILRGYTTARQADELHLTFYWEALRSPSVDYTVAIRLVRPDGSFWLDYVNYPGMGTSLPTTWKPGVLRADEYVFDVDRFPTETAPLRLIVGFFDPTVRDMLPVSNWANIRENGWATLTELQITNH